MLPSLLRGSSRRPIRCSGIQVAYSSRKRRQWSAPGTRDEFLQQLRQRLDVNEDGKWLLVTRQQVLANGGRGLIAAHGDSWLRVLKEAFPSLGITEEQCGKRRKPGHWDSPAARRAFMDHAAEQLGLRHPRQWKAITRQQLRGIGGGGLLARYRSMAELLAATYPELTEDELPVAPLLPGHWDTWANQLKFMRMVADTYGVEKPADWQRVSRKQVEQLGGSGLLKLYSSMFDLLQQTVLSDDALAMDVRPQVPAGFWHVPANVRTFMNRAGHTYGVTKPEDWYRISRAQIEALPRGKSLLTSLSMVDALRSAYPDEKWDEHRCLKSNKRAAQRWLAIQVQRAYKDEEVLEDARLPELSSTSKAGAMEVDVYVPGRKLALEYQGRQHYVHVPFFGPLEVYQERDKEKRLLCEAAGIRLVDVPYWWNNDLGSLMATIAMEDEALVPAAQLSLAHRSAPIPTPAERDPANTSEDVLVGSIHDGVKVSWFDGELASQSGRTIHVPETWARCLPREAVEGILCMTDRPDGGVGQLCNLVASARDNTTTTSA